MRKLIEKIDTWKLRRRLRGIMRNNKIPLSNEEKEILRKREETRGEGPTGKD